MPVVLSEDLRAAVEVEGTPLRLFDPTTGRTYLLVSEPEAIDLCETYRAQVETAMQAGWNDPAMDAYNDYDRHFKP